MKIIPLLLVVFALAFSCVAGSPQPANTIAPPSATVAPAAAATTATAVTIKSPRPIGYSDLSALLAAPGSNALLLDVRTKEEYDSGHIAGSVLMPFDAIKVSFVEADRNRPIVVYCRSGRRSSIAAETLAEMGYTDVSDFGGIDNWKGSLER